MKKIFLSLMLLSLLVTAVLKLNAQSWNLAGNSGTVVATNFIGTKDNKAFVFRTNNIERMRIVAGGNLGIGTKTPAAKLNVDGGAAVSLSAGGYLVLGNTTYNNMVLDYNMIQSRYGGDANNLLLNYFGGNIYMGNEGKGLKLTSDGKIGINGESDPYFTFNINAVSASGGLKVSADDGSGSGIYARSTNGYGVDAYSSTLDGLYSSTGDNINRYAAYFNGVVLAQAYYQGSDQKLKQNIRDFQSAMDIINELHPKQYDYRHDGNYKLMNLPPGNHYGLIAQDVAKVLPDLVKDSKFETPRKPNVAGQEAIKSETIDFKALNYTELIPIIIKGMQEQQGVNDQQQEQIQQQQQRIDKLEKIIEKLSGNSNTSLSNLSFENSSAYLKQNTPNPFAQNTIIYCNVPATAKLAQLMIYNQDGSKIKSFDLTNGINNLTISAGSLSSGQYVYSLFIDGKNIGSKKMILTK